MIDIKGMAVLLSPFNTGDLYSLKSKCEGAKSYEACFWYYVKAK